MRVWPGLVLCALASAAQADVVAGARAAAEELASVQARLESAGEGASGRIAALTEAVAAFEVGLGAMREGLRQVAAREQALHADLAARQGEVAALMGALQSMGRAPAPLLLLHPSGPLGTARGGMLAADIAPAIQVEVDALSAKLAELAELRALQQDAGDTLQAGLSAVQQARAALAEAAGRRSDLPRRFTADPVRTALLVASAETMDAFAGSLGETVERELRNLFPDATPERGAVALPVAGEILRRFNEPDAAGIARPGLLLATEPRALVTTPVAATIRFRGPLLDYGTVLILEPAPEVLFILAGLAQAFGEPGQVVPAGAPIGLMGGETPSADRILTESQPAMGGNRSQTLYLEVRDGQGPVDPEVWFALPD